MKIIENHLPEERRSFGALSLSLSLRARVSTPMSSQAIPLHLRLKVSTKNQPYLVGGFNPSEKYESQLGWLLPIYEKIKNVPNHQPDICWHILTN